MTNWDTSPGTNIAQDKNPPWLPFMPTVPNPVPGNAGTPGTQYPDPLGWQYSVDGSGNSIIGYPGAIFVGTPPNKVATLADIAASTTGVSSWNTRTGAVTLTLADITGAGGAPSNNPTFVGSANYATQPPGTNSTLLATTAFVQQALNNQPGVYSWNGRQGAVTMTLADVTGAGGAPSASPMLTGVPQAPTAALNTNTQQLATTAFVMNQVGNTVVSWNGRIGAVTLTLSDVTSVGGAPINAPVFTGVASAVTAAPGTATTQLATTAFVTNAVQAATVGVSSFNSRTGAVTLQAADISGAGGALLAGPALTGVPTAPTAPALTNTTQIATCAFVETAIAGAGVVASFNGRTGAVTLQGSDVSTAGALMVAGGTMTGALTLNANAAAALQAVPYQQLTSVTATLMPLAGGTFTGPVTLAGNATGNLQPVTLQQLQTYLPLTGGTLSGGLNVNGGPLTVPLQSGSAGAGTLTFNASNNGTNWIYNANGGAAAINITGNSLAFFVGPTGTAGGAITLSTPLAMTTNAVSVTGTLSTTGNVTTSGLLESIGSGRVLSINNGGNPSFTCYDNNAGNNYAAGMCVSTGQTLYFSHMDSSGNFVGTLGVFNISGSLTIAGTLTQGSDATKKTNIQSLTQGISVVKQLLPKAFAWLTSPQQTQWGFLAQDVEPVIPEAVSQAPTDPGGNPGTLSLDPTAILAAIVNAVKQLDQRAAAIEAHLGITPPAAELA